MLLVRPIRVSDLPALEHFAEASGVGVTSLPNDRERLYERIQRSNSSFASDIASQGEEIYVFVLERDGEVLGTASIVASAGFDEPFYNYRNETLVHASPSLKVNNKIHALTMCHDLTGQTQLGGFHVLPEVMAGDGARLLSRARLMFIASHRARFSDRLIAELLGQCDDNLQSPFWDAIGRRLFNLDYAAAEHLVATKSKTFVAELMPTYPIYVPLLPDAAQQVMGQVHPDAEVPFAILADEGFEADNYIDIFDGGAVLTARARDVRSISKSRVFSVGIDNVHPEGSATWLVSSERCVDFRSGLLQAGIRDNTLWITPDAAEALQVVAGDRVRAIEFQGEGRDAA